MKILYSEKQSNHAPRWEWSYGRKVSYPEKKTRIRLILKELKKRGFGSRIAQAPPCRLSALLRVHSQGMVEHIRACAAMPEGEAVFAHVFPYRSYDPHPKTDLRRAGYYCFDVGTQLDRNTWAAAKSAVDVAVKGAALIQNGDAHRVFALCRPPGHHADHAMYGGYCYFNNAAIAALRLSEIGKVAILDLDFHHGNGTQSIFYEAPNVYVASLHGDPRIHYPYFSGFTKERGSFLGKGTNLNIPLPDGTDTGSYMRAMEKALKEISKFRPSSLVVSIGFDIFKNDPLGTFNLSPDDFYNIGKRLADTGLPILACLEGGYSNQDLGINAANFYEGLVVQD